MDSVLLFAQLFDQVVNTSIFDQEVCDAGVGDACRYAHFLDQMDEAKSHAMSVVWACR